MVIFAVSSKAAGPFESSALAVRLLILKHKHIKIIKGKTLPKIANFNTL
jgi:hypothetical protein